MKRKNEYTNIMVVTSIIILIPIIIGLLLWQRLPDTIATHFGANNQANGWSSKSFTVIALPVMMLAIQWFAFLSTYYDPKRKNIDPKVFKLILWLIPIINLIVMTATYGIALDYNINVGMIVNFAVGSVFILIGNFLHKVKQNYTIGIKISWTLHSKENWNRTNRLAAWLLMLAGIVLLLNSYFQITWLVAIIVPVAVILPIIYSFVLYRRGV